MDQELVAKIETATIPDELKRALARLGEGLDMLLPVLPVALGRRTRFLFGRVVVEATDATVATHWWESALDLVAKPAKEYDKAGRPVLEAARQLVPLLRARLGPYDQVTLREITDETVYGICLLSDTLTEPKMNFVAPNAISLAQAHFNKYAWFRAIYAGTAPVGFLMMVDDPDKPEYFLWRFMIAQPFHGRGYGGQAIRRLVEYVKTRPNAKELVVSCGLGNGSPEGFYLKQGFVSTGEIKHEELYLRMPLTDIEKT